MHVSDQLSLVSSHAPRMPSEVLSRARLTEALLPLAAVTVVRGPGGAGKTVLLGQLVAQLPQGRGGWITVEESTASRLEFWRHVIARTLGEEHAQRMFGENLIDITLLIRALVSAGRPVVIVIDDVHLVGEPIVFEDILAITRAAAGVSFLLATRTHIPALEDPAEALTLDISVVTEQDLQFTASEIAAFAGVSAHRAEEFQSITGGNALLLRALQLGVQRHTEEDAVAGANEVLRGYLERYLVSVGESLASFMQRTSLSDDFSATEAQETTGHVRVSGELAQLEGAGLLTRQVIGGEERFRYHPLVREFLRAELTASKSIDVADLHGIVARQLASRGDEGAALTHALLARDFDLASRMLLLGGTDLLRSTPYEAFAEVPLRVAAYHPLLAAGRALKENARGARWVAREFFAVALVASRSLAVRNTPERASMAVLESVTARLQGKPKEAVAAATRALGLINRLGSDSLLGDQVYQLMSMCAVSFFRAGQQEGMRRILDVVPTASLRGGLVCASLGAVSAAADGDWLELTAIENSVARAGWREQEELAGYRGALLQLALILRDLAGADTESARRRMQSLGEHLPTLEFRILFAAAEAVAALIDGDPERAQLVAAGARRSEEAAQRLSPNDADLLSLVEALAAAAGGWTGTVQKHLDSLHASSRWGGLLRAHFGLLQADHVAAARHLSVGSIAAATEPRVARTRFLLLAWLGLESGDADAARAAVLSASGITRTFGEDGSLMLIPADVRGRLAELLDSDESDAAAAARELLMAPLPSPFAVAPPHPRLTKREFIVLSELQSHNSNAEIATILGISPNTVKTQLRSAYRKLGVGDRSQALVRMAVLGITGTTAESSAREPDDVS